jgi:hypothetical protein
MSLGSNRRIRTIETRSEAKSVSQQNASNEFEGTDDGNFLSVRSWKLCQSNPERSGQQTAETEPPRREAAGLDHSTDNNGSDYGSEDETFDTPKPEPTKPKTQLKAVTADTSTPDSIPLVKPGEPQLRRSGRQKAKEFEGPAN